MREHVTLLRPDVPGPEARWISSALPPDLLGQSAERLRVLALLYAFAFFLAGALPMLLVPADRALLLGSFIQWGPMAIPIAIALLVAAPTANIFLCRYGEEYDFVKVLDFGIVKAASDTVDAGPAQTRENAVHGTPAFIAPEQAMGTLLDGRSDIYATVRGLLAPDGAIRLYRRHPDGTRPPARPDAAFPSLVPDRPADTRGAR
jgi:hypothetical protein